MMEWKEAAFLFLLLIVLALAILQIIKQGQLNKSIHSIDKQIITISMNKEHMQKDIEKTFNLIEDHERRIRVVEGQQNTDFGFRVAGGRRE